jgi:hypothetical protein
VGIAVGTQVETGGVEQAQNVLAGARRVLELGLEAVAEEEDEIRLPDRRDILRRDLEVVRLRPGRSEVLDVYGAVPDLFGGLRERIEARYHGLLRRRRRGATSAARRADEEHRRNENEYQSHKQLS